MTRFFNPASIAFIVIATGLLGFAVNWERFPTAAEQARFNTAIERVQSDFDREAVSVRRQIEVIGHANRTPLEVRNPFK